MKLKIQKKKTITTTRPIHLYSGNAQEGNQGEVEKKVVRKEQLNEKQTKKKSFVDEKL